MKVQWDIEDVSSTAQVEGFTLQAWEGPETWHWGVQEGLRTLTTGEAPSHSTARWAAEEALKGLGRVQW